MSNENKIKQSHRSIFIENETPFDENVPAKVQNLNTPESSKDTTLANTVQETDDLWGLLDNDDAANIKHNDELEADPFSDESSLDEELEPDDTESPEDEVLLTDTPTDEFANEESREKALESEHFETLLDEFFSNDSTLEEESESNYAEPIEDDFLLADAPLAESSVDELVETASEEVNFAYQVDDTPPNGFDSVEVTHLFTEIKVTGQPESVTAKEIVPSHSHENQLQKSGDDLSAVPEIEVPEASIAPDIRESVVDNQYTQKKTQKSLVVLALLVVLGGTAAAWYGYNNIGSGILSFGENGQQDQLNQNNQNRHVKQEAMSSVGNLLDTQENQGSLTRKNPVEFLALTMAITQLGTRIALVEKKLIGYESIAQTVQVEELEQQLKLLQQAAQDSIRMDQDVSDEITLQLKQLDFSIHQLENQVGRLGVQQNSNRNSTSLLESSNSAITTGSSNVQSKVSSSGAQVTKLVDSPPKETGQVKQVPSRPADGLRKDTDKVKHVSSRPADDPPKDAVKVRQVSSQPDKKIPAKVVYTTTKQPNWVVNLASFKKRDLAVKEQKRFNGLGVKTIIMEVQVQENTWYRVSLKEVFSSTLTARDYIAVLLRQNKIEDAWVSVGRL